MKVDRLQVMNIENATTKNLRAQSFNQIAELYDTARPSYPPKLIKDVVKLTQLSATSQILEIGTGTGKATLPFAQRGYTIRGLEPGDNLAIAAAQNLQTYPNVTIETTTFENWPIQPNTCDLVMSAQAFHWVDPEVGYFKVAQALKPEGKIALIWNIATKPDSAIAQDLDQIYTTYAHWRTKSFDEQQQARERELSDSPYFSKPTVKRYSWSLRYTTEQYLDLVRTQSDYLIQPKGKQQALLSAIASLIENNGGSLLRPYVSLLLLAQKSRE